MYFTEILTTSHMYRNASWAREVHLCETFLKLAGLYLSGTVFNLLIPASSFVHKGDAAQAFLKRKALQKTGIRNTSMPLYDSSTNS